ncbi:hypothetical protein O1611_g6202 [Lasiodiplodia mahajangana]|uniref:Uncharacterized protein n=1 Tax=Lasiodiplodia mahajangana TaxID=1108764 RepID=A0ACC2JJA0_9PEZI|nr:hypothetical protein O1611_g6202 [Lasiodiplodia mahajangana]
MNKPENIDYKGIGEGLSVAFDEDVSSSESTISLNDDWQIVTSSPSHQESDSSESTVKPTVDSESEVKSNADSLACSAKRMETPTSRNSKYALQNLTPLERYCYCVETHEQLATGQISGRRSLTQPNELDDSLNAAAKLFDESSCQFSASPWSILSSASGGGLDTAELDYMPLMIDSSEWQSLPEGEQADCLRRIRQSAADEVGACPQEKQAEQ